MGGVGKHLETAVIEWARKTLKNKGVLPGSWAYGTLVSFS